MKITLTIDPTVTETIVKVTAREVESLKTSKPTIRCSTQATNNTRRC